MADAKQAYVSPPTGALDITIIKDAQPRVAISLDLGIPNFTVFSMTFPLVEDQPKTMSSLIAEAVNVLLDEVASFMISMEYADEIVVQMYATVLAAFKGMSKEADSSREQDATGADPIVRTFEGTFNLPMSFVNETQKKVVTGAQNAEKMEGEIGALLKRQVRTPAADTGAYEKIADELGEMLDRWEPHFMKESLLEEESEAILKARSWYADAKGNLERAKSYMNERRETIAASFVHNALTDFRQAVNMLDREPEQHVSAASKIKRLPPSRHIELTYEPKPKTTVGDAARVIRQYRNRSLKQQPKPLYVIVYDQMGRPTGTLSLGPQFKNKLLQLTKRAAVEFVPPLSFPDELALKNQLLPPGIPEAISVGGMTYLPEAVAGHDMALYHGPQDWLVKFVDGRSAIFPGRPTFRNMRRLNFPVPRNRFKWTILPPKAEQSIREEEAAPKAENQTTRSEVKV